MDLYLDMDGVLVDLSDNNGVKLVPCAMEFLEWAIKNFRCHYLTCWDENEIHKIFPMLPKFDYRNWWIKNGKYGSANKVNGIIDIRKPFIWLEDGITSEERDTLEKIGRLDCYHYINPMDNMALIKWKEKWDKN